MENPAPHATEDQQENAEENDPIEGNKTHKIENMVAVNSTDTLKTKLREPQEEKTILAISWISVALAFLPLIILVFIADGYDSIQKFSPTESIFFPVVMFAITCIGSKYARKANSFVPKALNALFGTFYVFLFMLYLASGIIGLSAVLIIPLILPVVLPVVFLWLLGVKVTLSKLRKEPVDKDGNPINPHSLDPMKATLPDKTFAEIVFQILGVFISIILGYFITTGIISLI